MIADNGTYALKYKGRTGVPIGTFSIAVVPYVRKMTDEEFAGIMELSEEEQAKERAQRYRLESLIPEKYLDTETSGLSYEIVQGTQAHDIAIEK